MFKKIALLTICLLSAICITACGSGGTENNYDFTVNDITIEVGEQVLVMPQFSDGKSHDYSVTVMSGGTCISASGKSITGKKEGLAEIRVTSGSESKTLTVTVLTAWNVIFTPAEEMAIGERIALSAEASDERETNFSFSIISGAEYGEIVEGELVAKLPGTITVRAKDEISGKQVDKEVVVIKPLASISSTDITITQDESVTAPVTVVNNYDNLTVEYSVLGGDGEISMLGETLVGITVGTVEMEARLAGTDISTTFTITVMPRDYTIEANDLSLYYGDTVTLAPVITPAVYEALTYTVTRGTDVVSVIGGELTAIGAGEAEVTIAIVGTTETKTFLVTVNAYKLTVQNVQVFKGEKVTPTPVLEPAVDGVKYTIEVIMGADVVSVQSTSIWGEKAGVATVRCTAVGKNAYCDFEVKVTECKINVQGKTLIVGETYTPTVTVDPEIPGFTVRYLIISGSKVVSVSGNTIKADSIGKATVRCVIDGTGFFADFNIEVINYVITAKDLEIYEGDITSLGATVSPYKKLVYEVIAGENAITVYADGGITAKEKGQAVVRITAEGTDVYTDVTVLVKGYTVTAENIEMMVLGGALINATVSPEKGRTVTYTIREGHNVITLEGNKVVAVAPGVAVVRVSVEGVDAKVDITVTVNNYEIYSPNVSLYIGSTAKLQPTATPEKQFSYRYEVISGKDVVSVSSGVVTALKQGVAEIKITANEVPAEKIIKVTVADYAITVDDMRVYVGETKRIEAVVVPSKDSPVFAFDIISGDDYIEIANGSIIGVAPGRAIVRCSMSGSFAHFDFTVTVEHEMVAVPAGYVKISDSLYASYSAGRYKSAIVIDFFTPYKKAQLYYTSDGKQYNRDYSFSSRWSGPVWLTERKGTLSDYTLTQQVDAALTWAGGNKNYSGDYVTKAQNGGQYNLINLGYVYNVAVVLENQIVDTATQTYIIYSGYELDEMPIISLSMAPELWFDGIPNGKGESVYNNVYIPGGNAQNEKTARANLEFFDNNGGFEVNTQVKVGGGWSRGRPQRTLHLNFLRDENGVEQGYVEYEIFGDGYTTQDDPTESLNTFSRFRLHNGGSTYDSYTRMNDAIIQNISRGLSVSTTAWRPAIVYLNGEFWGMYHIREHYADVYFKENYDVKKGNVEYFDYTGGTYHLTDGDSADASAFIAEMNAFLNDSTKNFGDDAVFNEFFDKYVDEQSLMDLTIIQTFVGNWDWVGNGNNHRAWRTATVEEGNIYTDGKLRYCLHDLDFGMAAATNEPLMISQVGPSNRAGNVWHKYKLLNRALSNEGFRQRLYARAEYIIGTYFNYERACKIIDDMVAKYEPAFYIDNDRWWKPQGYTAWKNAIANAKSWIKNRPSYFFPELRRILSLDEIPEMNATGSDVVYSKDRINVFEFYEGNGSISDKRAVISGLSLTDYSVEYYAVRSGLNGIQNGPFFLKLRYDPSNNNKTIVVRFNDGGNSRAYIDVKEGTDSATYNGSPGGKPLYEGVHKVKFTKQGNMVKLYVNDALLTQATLPDAVANKPIVTIDLYQHGSNMIYRNFVIRKL